MSVEPMDVVEQPDEGGDGGRAHSRLNSAVAVTVALLATFLGVCQVKDGNIVQAMAQAQADQVDSWAWYQAKKIRLQFAQAMADQFGVQLLSAPPAAAATLQAKVAEYKAQVDKQQTELNDVQAKAEAAKAQYDELNSHDDQFDLSEAMVAIAISLLAVSALTHKRWLYGLALVPTVVGAVFGCAGLLGWGLSTGLVSQWLGA